MKGKKIQHQRIKNQTIVLSGRIRKRIGYLHAIKPCILPLLKYLHRVLGINRPVNKIKKDYEIKKLCHNGQSAGLWYHRSLSTVDNLLLFVEKL